MPSVYIHIPFCQSRCIYCDFYSTTSIKDQERYVECLLQEMRSRKNEMPSRAHTLSIYIGGGTPSTLPPHLLQRLLNETASLFSPTTDAEITVEANPDDVTEEWVVALRQTPVNRVSMGVQTFHDDLLKTLRRRHDAQQAIEAVHRLQDAGYNNLSIDLIYGLPGQTLEMWKSDILQALSLKVPHLSAYSLMYEEGTPITYLLEQGKIKEMDDETSLQCYQMLCDELKKAGYLHYEISNFSLPNMHSRHNSAYWTGQPYLGFGAGAHSYDGGTIRRWNHSSLHDYLDSPLTCFEEERLSATDLYNEFIMTRLRTSKGFDLNDLQKRFGENAAHYCQDMMKPHLQQGNLVQTGSQVCLSRLGVFVSNDVMSDLFIEE